MPVLGRVGCSRCSQRQLESWRTTFHLHRVQVPSALTEKRGLREGGGLVPRFS